MINICDEQHKHTMMLLHQEIQKAQGVCISVNALIAVALIPWEMKKGLDYASNLTYLKAKYPGICNITSHATLLRLNV